MVTEKRDCRLVTLRGGSFLRRLLREIRPRRRNLSIDRLEKKHDINFGKSIRRIEILPGSQQLLQHLAKVRVQWAIATTGNKRHTARLLKKFDLPSNAPVITCDVAEAKPAPNVFVVAAERTFLAGYWKPPGSHPTSVTLPLNKKYGPMEAMPASELPAVGGDGAQEALASPIENTLFFAGEATDISGHNGTVHGAIASGRRAASEIQRSLR
jgi:hypothetical protein